METPSLRGDGMGCLKIRAPERRSACQQSALLAWNHPDLIYLDILGVEVVFFCEGQERWGVSRWEGPVGGGAVAFQPWLSCWFISEHSGTCCTHKEQYARRKHHIAQSGFRRLKWVIFIPLLKAFSHSYSIKGFLPGFLKRAISVSHDAFKMQFLAHILLAFHECRAFSKWHASTHRRMPACDVMSLVFAVVFMIV